MSTSVLDRPAPPASARIAYGDDPLQFADLRRPGSNEGPFPGVIAIHGGFWRNRYSLEHLGHLCAALTEQGIATWNVEYRRVGDPGGGYPGTFHDIAAAATYLVDHAGELGIDPQRIVVLGHSAGGHLASWLASLANVPEDSSIHSDPIPLRGAVPLAGVLDLERCHELGLSDDAVGAFLGGPPQEAPDRYAAASPIKLVPSPVPHLLVHGTFDEIVPIGMSERYQVAATRAGGLATVLTLPRADHFDVIDPTSPTWPAIIRAVGALATG